MKKLLHLPLALVLLLFATKTTFTQVYNFSNSTSANGLPSNMTTALIQDFRGYLWVGTENGLARFDGTNFVNYDKFQGLSENAIADLKVDEHGNIFAFHPNKFVTKISKDYNFEIIDSTADKSNLMSTTALQCEIEKKRIIRIKDKRNKEIFSISSKNGLINDHINDAVVGRENILWIASANNGIYSLPLQNFPVYEWPYPDFVSQYRLNAETNLITFKNHIVRLRFNGEKPEYSLVFSSTRKEFNCAVIQFGKQLFYGTDKGMFLYFSETGKEFSFDEMADKNVTHIEKIGNGDLLIIADNKVYRYIVYDNEIELVEGTKNFLAYSIQKVKNTIYVTGKENIYQLKNKKFIPLLNTHEIAKSQDFIHISQTANNELWLSAANGGVFLFNPQSDKLEYFNEEKNLPISATTSTIEENNNLWISAQGEIIWYDIKQNTYSRFGNKYLNEKLFVPFTIRNKENYYFLTREGLVQTFDSESFEGSDNILNITDILVQGLPVASDSLIELKYNSFPIQFNYQSISLKDKTYYQVKLEGKDKDWSTSTLKTTSSYEKLEPGDYTFRVRTTGPINEVVLNTEKIKFTVLQPYWKTAIFFYILLIVISVLVLMFYVFRILTLKRRSEKLEKLINEKTYVLSAQNQNIEQFSYSLSHDLKNPINNI
ncbi:MAG: two-component regulator propeller domain-containing protein, partial [Flavobacteriales bacterium]